MKTTFEQLVSKKLIENTSSIKQYSYEPAYKQMGNLIAWTHTVTNGMHAYLQPHFPSIYHLTIFDSTSKIN